MWNHRPPSPGSFTAAFKSDGIKISSGQPSRWHFTRSHTNGADGHIKWRPLKLRSFWISGLSLMTALWFLIIRYFLKRLNGNYVQFKRHKAIASDKIHVEGKETCSDAETVPSTVQCLPICCPLGHLIGCPSRNISRRDRKWAQKEKKQTQNGGRHNWISGEG